MTLEKVQFQLEIPLNSSKGVLFNCISTPSGLAEWFCDDVNIKKDVHIFFWDGSEESARMVSKKKDEFVKFRWLEALNRREERVRSRKVLASVASLLRLKRAPHVPAATSRTPRAPSRRRRADPNRGGDARSRVRRDLN